MQEPGHHATCLPPPRLPPLAGSPHAAESKTTLGTACWLLASQRIAENCAAKRVRSADGDFQPYAVAGLRFEKGAAHIC